MDERSSRIFFGMCMLVLIWIGVYWMWQPSRDQDPKISFSSETRTAETKDDPAEIESESDPVTQPTVDSNPSDLTPGTGVVAQVDSPPQSPPDQSTRLIPPEFIEHTVSAGERMQTIAKSYYGSIDDWTIIAKANPRVDPQKLKLGMTLRIPKDKDNIQGKLVGEDTQPGVITSSVPSESKVIEYVVRPGDSLSVISSRIYGSSRHATFIFESNRDILRSIDSISVGQLLKLPPLPDQDQD
jgi:nucleoid-associated protein YgaU